MADKTIYNLALHEGIAIESKGKDATTYWQVLRVHDGWIYTQWDSEKQAYTNDSIHVKFDSSPIFKESE